MPKIISESTISPITTASDHLGYEINIDNIMKYVATSAGFFILSAALVYYAVNQTSYDTGLSTICLILLLGKFYQLIRLLIIDSYHVYMTDIYEK